MVNKDEGYATVKRALDVLLETTKKTLSDTEKLREDATQDEREMIIHKNTEIARLTHEITELEAKKAQKSRGFDEKIATLKAEIQNIIETKKAIEIGIASKPERKCDLCGKPHTSEGVGSVCPDCINPPEPEIPTTDTEIPLEKTKPKKKAFGVGQHNRPTVSSKITGIIENLLEEGRWETNKTMAEALVKNGYPAKHSRLYASKGVNVLKWQEKAVTYSVGKTAYWRSAKFPNLPIPRNGGK